MTDISNRVELEELNQPACGWYTLQPFRGSMEHFLTDISNRVELEELNQPACGWSLTKTDLVPITVLVIDTLQPSLEHFFSVAKFNPIVELAQSFF